MKKKIIIIFLAVLLLIMIFIAYSVHTDLKEEEILYKEIDNIIASNFEVYDKNKTYGKYLSLEKEIKTSLEDFQKTSKNIIEKLENKEYLNIMNLENLKKDMPEFTASYEKIASLENDVKSAEAFLKEEERMPKLDSYYLDLYKKIMKKEEIENFKYSKRASIQGYIDKLKPLILVYKNALDFLKTNKGMWEINNNQLYFYNDDLTKKYNEIIGGK